MKISLALCTYNGEKYIEKQLNSILEQTVIPNEIIISDDRSTDNTISIIKRILKKFNGVSGIYINDRNLGTIKNFEKAISLTTGDIIFLSDQDDIWLPNKIEKILIGFKQQPKALLFFTNGNLIDENDINLESTLWNKWNFESVEREKWKNNKFAFKNLLKNNNKITGATVAFKKELKKNVLPIHVPNDYWHDTWLALHASALNGLFFIEESLIKYRIHSNQQVGIPESIRTTTKSLNFINSLTAYQYENKIRMKYPFRFSLKKHFLFSLKNFKREIRKNRLK